MKRIVTIIIVLLLVSIIYLNTVSAYNLELELSADKTDVKVGDEVTVTLNISKGMQAADFTINYDSNLLKFKSGSLGSNFYNANTPGKVVFSWFDTNDKNTFTFTFIAISSGVAEFSTTTENFYDGNLKSASSYNEGSLNITLLSSNSLNTNENKTNALNTNNTQNTSSTQEMPNITQTTEQKKEETLSTTTSSNKKIVNAPTSTNSSNYTTQSQLSSTNSTSTNKSLPQTGESSTLFICIAIGVITLAIISKIKLNKLRDI